MGQSKTSINRTGGSFGGNFLSPSTGTSPVPIKALTLAIGVFGLAFIASCVTASIATPVQNSDAAQQVQLSLDDSGYYANVSASDIVDLDLIATQDGAISIAKDTVTTKTNSTTGYMLYISSDSATANANRLNLDGSISASSYFSPTAGTLTTPAVLSSNSWGYSLTTLEGNNGEVTETSNFIGMPLLNSENLLHKHTSAAPSGDSVDVYYGVKANTALPSGYYSSKVVYTVVAEGSPATDNSVNISNNESTTLTPSNQTITISTGLYTSAISAGDVTVKIGDNDCVIPDGGVTKSNSGEVKVTCTVPSQTAWGDYDVAVVIPKYDKEYTKEKGFHYYVPWEEMTTMQEMTAYACSKVTTPYATVGNAARTYSYGGGVTEDQIKANPTSTDYWKAGVADQAKMTNILGVTDTTGTGSVNTVAEKTLTDTRDGNIYIIRKLADGNCWMNDNLQLVFAEDAVNSIGKVDASGNIVAQNPVVTINSSNSNVSDDWNSAAFAAKLAYTETSTNKTVWGATDGEDKAHPSGGSVNTSSEDYTSGASSKRAIAYSRSYYRAGTINTKDGEVRHYGVYYNWRAATAGTGTTSVSVNGTNLTDSICPKGWRLPTTDEFQSLIYKVYGGEDLNTGNRQVSAIAATSARIEDYHTYAMTDALQRAPLSFPLTGLYRYSSSSLGSIGAWWSSTANSDVNARDLDFYSGYLYPQGASHKGFGFTVRCVAQ